MMLDAAPSDVRECTVCLPCTLRCVHLGSNVGWLLDTEHAGYPPDHARWSVDRFEVAFGRVEHYCRCQGEVKHMSIMSEAGPMQFPTRELAEAEFFARAEALRLGGCDE